MFTLLIVILLIGIPAGYIVVSAGQSRDSGEDKQARAAATGLTAGWPSKVTRRIYDVPITGYSADVAWYETNSWNTSKLYAQFVTSDKGLDLFLSRIDSSRSALREGRVTISEREAAEVGWKLGAGEVSDSSYALDTGATRAGDWSGMVHKQRSPEPTLDITVDFSNPAHPKVYVVSTVKL
ncbi:hypothetical protein CRI70_02395 [Streptomyces sp. Ru87]|nr:hypothetical protein CRI70_02395 [Streptomyces sp. Ru87]